MSICTLNNTHVLAKQQSMPNAPNGGDVATVVGVLRSAFVFVGFLHLMPPGGCIHRKLTF